MKNLLQFLFLLAFMNSCSAQENKNSKIQWMSWQEALAKNEKAPKKVFIDVYTHWCGWCKRMDASTFSIDSIADYMNSHFYNVKLDAESKDTFHFKEKEFVYKPEFKSNELALALLAQQMSFPTYVFMDENYQLLSPLPGYKTPEQLMPVLKYFGENIYLNKTWEDYSKEIPN